MQTITIRVDESGKIDRLIKYLKSLELEYIIKDESAYQSRFKEYEKDIKAYDKGELKTYDEAEFKKLIFTPSVI